MTTDPLNLAAVLVALFILAAVVRFASREITPKEPAMETQHLTPPTRASLQRAAARRASAAASFYRASLPVRVLSEDPLSFDFIGDERRALAKVARLDSIAHQHRIAWADLTDDEIEALRDHPACDRRADRAWSKRYSRAVRAAKRGVE